MKEITSPNQSSSDSDHKFQGTSKRSSVITTHLQSRFSREVANFLCSFPNFEYSLFLSQTIFAVSFMHYIQNVRLKDKLSLQDRYVSLNFNNYFIINIVLWLQLNRTRNLRKNLQINFSTLSNLYFLQKAKNFTSLNI